MRTTARSVAVRGAVVLVAAVLLLAACSGDGSDDPTGSGAPGSTGTSTTAADGGGGSGSSGAEEGDVHEITGDATIQATAGSPFTLSLAANPTTGYSWSQRVDGGAVRETGDRYQPPSEAVPGRGGTQLYTYAAVEAGTATIDLTYTQVGSGDVGQAYTVTVEVT